MEKLVKKAGREAEQLVVKYFNMTEIPAETRIKIIMAAGDIMSPFFLVPLKKIIDTDPSIHIKKAAITAISRYANQQAMNILSAVYPTIGNPYLQNTILQQIDYIKKNNPVLALLPRFLKGDKDKKSFMVVMDLLKKNIKPQDISQFIGYLKSEDAAVRGGAFNILCTMGERTLQSNIFDFYFERANQLSEEVHGHCEELQSLTNDIKYYFIHFPSLIYAQLPKLKSLYPKIGDALVEKSLISILCHCRAPEALSYIQEIFNESDAGLKEYIIEESAENEQAIDFLFEKYRSGQFVKEKIIRALLKNKRGFDYFSEHFFTFPPEHQEIIIKNLPDTLDAQTVGFIKNLFKSDLKHLKTSILSRIRANYLFSFKEILFDPDRQNELFELEEDYLVTVTRLFPVQTVKFLFERIAGIEADTFRIKDYLNRIQDILRYEFVINSPDSHVISQAAGKVASLCNTDLTDMFLTSLERIKTFDSTTYKNLLDALNHFTQRKGEQLFEDEAYGVKRVRENFKNIVDELKKIEDLEKEVKRAVMKTTPDLGHLRKILESLHIGVSFKVKWIVNSIADYFKRSEEKFVPNWREFFKELPLLTPMVRDVISGNTQAADSFAQKLRIVIHFSENEYNALFKDQFNEVLPDFKIVIADRHISLEPTDTLVCDNLSLKEYINNHTLSTKRIYLLLESRSDFSSFKTLNPRAFFHPISAYRIVKQVLQELYLTRSV